MLLERTPYYYLEPHPDDMILSAGELFLQHPPEKVVTVFYGRNKSHGTKRICNKRDVKYENWKIPDIDFVNKRVEVTAEEGELIARKTRAFLQKGAFVLTNLGSSHAAHIWLRNFLINNIDKQLLNRLFFVRDFPNGWRKERDFYAQSKNMKLIQEIDDKKLFKQKIDLFFKNYNSQRPLQLCNKDLFATPVPEQYFIYKPSKKQEWW